MNFELSDEHRMVKELVRRFVDRELLPHEAGVLAREAAGQEVALPPDVHARIDTVSRDLGLWGLDAPADIGGADLPRWRWSASTRRWGGRSSPIRCRQIRPICGC